MSLSAWNEQKRKLVLQLLDHGMVMIHLDPRATGVVVPPRFRNDPTLRLNLAYGFNLPALDVAEEGIYAVLSFGGVDSSCSLPWEAVYAATLPDEDHRGMMWAGSLPPEGDALFGLPPRDVPANAAPGAAAAPDPAERVRPTLAESSTHHRRSGADSSETRSPFSVIQGGAGRGSDGDQPDDPTLPAVPSPKKSRPALRLVED